MALDLDENNGFEKEKQEALKKSELQKMGLMTVIEYIQGHRGWI